MKRATRSALVLTTLLVLTGLLGGCSTQGPIEPNPNVNSSTALVESPKKFNGTTVTFTGEAVGEAMARGGKAWIHLNDDAYYLKNVEEGAGLGGYNNGIAVWVDSSLTRRIKYFGDYKHEGDVVRVTGTFNAACSEHGGDLDIHATSLEIVAAGRHASDPVTRPKLVLAVCLALLAMGLYFLNRKWGDWAPEARRP